MLFWCLFLCERHPLDTVQDMSPSKATCAATWMRWWCFQLLPCECFGVSMSLWLIVKLSIWRIGSSILSCYQVSSPSTQTHPFFWLSLHVTKPSHCFPLSNITRLSSSGHLTSSPPSKKNSPPQVLVLTAYYNQRCRSFVMSEHRVSLSVLHVPFPLRVFPPQSMDPLLIPSPNNYVCWSSEAFIKRAAHKNPS